MNDAFAPRSRPWLTHGLAALVAFGVTSLAISSAVRRQTPILDSMELHVASTAAMLAYGWGSAEDAKRFTRAALALAERGGSEASPGAHGKDPDFAMLRHMDADLAKLRLALLEDAPRPALEAICVKATIRCTPTSLERILTMLKKQRHVPW